MKALARALLWPAGMNAKPLLLFAALAGGCASTVPTYEMHMSVPPGQALHTLADALAA